MLYPVIFDVAIADNFVQNQLNGQHMEKLESLTASHNLERQKEQKQILAFAGRINELEHLVQEKEKERKKAVLEMQGFKNALQQR